MKEHVLRFIGAVFLTILALMGVGAVLHILLTLPWEGKGPEWIGAIGTVAALIWAIWLATAETRRRERDSRTLARLHGAGMALRISQACATAREVNSMLFAKLPNVTPAFLRECDDKLNSIPLWETSELVPLVPLPFNTAVKLAEAADHIQTARVMLHRLLKIQVWHPVDVNTTLVSLRSLLLRSTEFLDDSLRECRLGAAELHLNID